MEKKISFWAVFSLVTGSQIGSSVFMAPANLAPFGLFAIWGWVLSGTGALALALIFGELCAGCPKTGGPHAYAAKAFGPTVGFFTGWTYWVISWVSTPVVIASSVGYLSPILGLNQGFDLWLQILLLTAVTWINLKGVKTAGNAEFILTLLKIIPLLIMPIFCFFYFDWKHFQVASHLDVLPSAKKIGIATMLILWGFVGLESGTAPASSVLNPSKTIPRAIILGTLSVGFLYFINGMGIMGLIPGPILAHSKAPYADAAQLLFGGNWHLVISIIAACVCIGTLNAWTLTSGQIALGLAEDQFFPSFFGKKNKSEAPYVSLWISYFGILILLFITFDESLAKQIHNIIDFSVVAFLFIYLVCAFSLIKILWEDKVRRIIPWCSSLGGSFFCLWVLQESSLTSMFLSLLFTLSGIPFYFFYFRNVQKKAANIK
jgi:APA family basic amino acid/polyamine antiporter